MSYKCAFAATLMGGDFACTQAQAVTRRTGPDIACQSETAHLTCEHLFQHLKDAALPVLGYEDDLLSMPHSVLVKVQFGGLLGLRGLMDGAAVTHIDDIAGLVERAAAHFDGLANIPCGQLVTSIADYKPARRRGR